MSPTGPIAWPKALDSAELKAKKRKACIVKVKGMQIVTNFSE
jgi:hypothetical protein